MAAGWVENLLPSLQGNVIEVQDTKKEIGNEVEDRQRAALQQRYGAKDLPILVDEEDECMKNSGEAFQGPPLVEMPNDNDIPGDQESAKETPPRQ